MQMQQAELCMHYKQLLYPAMQHKCVAFNKSCVQMWISPQVNFYGLQIAHNLLYLSWLSTGYLPQPKTQPVT